MSEAECRYAIEEDTMPMTVENIVHQVPAPPLLTPPLEELDDATLVAAAKGGQYSAFEVLARRYRLMIISVAWRFSRVYEDAEDVAQDAWLLAFKALPSIEDPRKFAAWLAAIARHRAMRFGKHENKLKVPYADVPISFPGFTLIGPVLLGRIQDQSG